MLNIDWPYALHRRCADLCARFITQGGLGTVLYYTKLLTVHRCGGGGGG